MKHALLISIVLLQCFLVSVYATPNGWQMEKLNDREVYTPSDLKTGEELSVTAFNSQSLNDITPKSWFKQVLAEKEGHMAEVLARYQVDEVRKSGIVMFSTLREYKDSGATKRIAYYMVLARESDAQVKLLSVNLTHDFELLKRYLTAVNEIAANSFTENREASSHTHRPETGSSLESWNRTTAGNTTIYTAPDLKPGEHYAITVYEAEKLEGKSLRRWLSAQMDRFESHLGTVRYRGRIKKSSDYDWVSSIHKYTDRSGRVGEMQYFALPLEGKQAQIVQIDYSNKALLERYPKSIGDAIRKTGYLDYQLAQKEAEERKKAEKERRRAREEALKKARWTAPNAGLKHNQIEAVTYYMDIRINAYGNAEPDITLYLLLKDGAAYENPTVPPSDFNVQASRKMEPERWSTWRKQSGEYQVKDLETGKWEKLQGNPMTPGRRGMHLAANLHHLKVWGNLYFGGGQSRRTIILSQNGRFETSAFSLQSSGSGASDAGLASVNVSSHKDKDGERSTFSSTVPGGSSTSAPAGAVASNTKKNQGGLDRVGDYTIDGYTIEFRHDSGRVTRKLFFIKDSNYIFIEDRVYSVKKPLND